KIPKTKNQKPNKLQVPSFKLQTAALCFTRPPLWNLVFGSYLDFGFWILEFVHITSSKDFVRHPRWNAPSADAPPRDSDDMALAYPSRSTVAAARRAFRRLPSPRAQSLPPSRRPTAMLHPRRANGLCARRR